MDSFALQSALGQYCRTGLTPPPSSLPDHMPHYRRLVSQIMKDSLKTAFPLTRACIGKKRWRKMTDQFAAQHPCQTPQIWRLPAEFVEFYSQNPLPFRKSFPFLSELLHYEWLDIDLFMMDDIEPHPYIPYRPGSDAPLVALPEIKILPLLYPVHLKNAAEIRPEDEGQYFVSFHRDFQSKSVKCHDLSYPFVALLVQLHEAPCRPSDLLHSLIGLGVAPDEAPSLLDQFINFARNQQLILGCAKPPTP